MVNLGQLLGIFFVTNSIRYIIFGSFYKFNDVIFNFFQFSSVNNYLYNYNNTDYQGISTLVMWSLFGMSPHDDIQHTLNYLNGVKYTNQNSTHNHSIKYIMFETEPNTTITRDMEDITFWFDTNKYMLVILTIFGILMLSISIYIIIQLLRTLRWYNYCYSIKDNDIIRAMDGSYYKVNPAYWNPSLHSFVIKIALMSYCNISTLTIYQILNSSSDTVGLSFVAFVFTLFIIIGFPAYVFYKLYYNKEFLNDMDFSDNYGPLYLYYKLAPVKNQFMIVTMIKQVMYSIALNISSQLTYTQNTIMLVINVIFTIMLYIVKPYRNTLYQLQAVMVSIGLTVVTMINYSIIYFEEEHDKQHLCIMINISVHILTMSLYIFFYAIDYCKNRKKPSIILTTVNGDGDQLIRNLSTSSFVEQIDIDKYQATSSVRFTDQLNDSLLRN